MTSQRLRRAILILFQLLLITVPFFFTWVNEELFELPKMLLTYGFTIVIASLWLSRMVLEKRIILNKTVFDWPLIIFFLSQLGATLFSIHPRTSIFGYYTRFHGGLLSTITYLVLFYAFVSNIKKKELASLWLTTLITALGVSFYAILEHFGHSISCSLITGQFNVACWVQDVQNRVYATFGQPNWLAAYLITLLPLAIVLSQQVKKHWLKILFIFSSFLLLIALLYTRSRSGMAGFLLSLIILTGGWLWLRFSFKKDFKNSNFSLIPILISLMVGIIIFNGSALTPALPEFLKQKTNPEQQIRKETLTQVGNSGESESEDEQTPTVNRLTVGGTDSGEIRKIVWSGAFKVWQRYPLLGSGTATFAYSYYQDRPQEHNLVSEWDFLYNKAHNEFLNFLATTGLFGLISYLGLLVSFFYVCTKLILEKKSQNKKASYKLNLAEKKQVLALLAGVSALTVSNFFGFSTVVVSILLFLFLGMVVLIKNRVKTEQTKQAKLDSWPQSLGLFIITLVALFLLGRVRRIFVADKSFATGQSYLDAGYTQQGLEALQKAVQLRPREALFHDKLANTYSKLAIAFDQQEATSSAERFKEAALQEAQLTQKLNPRHLNFYKSHARILIQLSQLDPDLLNQAKQILEAGTILAPTDAKLLYNLGLIHLELGDEETGIKTLEKALRLKPNYFKVQEKLTALKKQEETQ